MYCIYIALRTSADIPKCCTETKPKTPNSKQCRCRITVARKNSLERPEPRKKHREEPGYEGWPVLFWLCRVEIITEHGQDVQMFIDDQQGQVIIITVVVEGATGQHLGSKCQLAFHSRSFRVSTAPAVSRELKTARLNRSGFHSRTVETGAAARPGGLETARSHQARLS